MHDLYKFGQDMWIFLVQMRLKRRIVRSGDADDRRRQGRKLILH